MDALIVIQYKWGVLVHLLRHEIAEGGNEVGDERLRSEGECHFQKRWTALNRIFIFSPNAGRP